MSMWPAAMKRSTAAKYCDLSVTEFELAVSEETLPGPMPIALGRHPHWNKAQLDTALEKISGGQALNWRAQCGLPEQPRKVA